jgi:MFS family permease
MKTKEQRDRPPRLSRTKTRTAIRISIQEGIFAQFFGSLAGAGAMFITGFALYLGAKGWTLGILTACGPLAQVVQVLAALHTRNLASRKDYVLNKALIARLFPFLWLFLPFFLPKNISLIIFLALYTASNLILNLAGNAWTGWISDLIPQKFRGRFFGIRNMYLSIAAIGIGYVGAIFIDLFRKNPSPLFKLLSRFNFRLPDKLHIYLSTSYGDIWGFAVIFFVGGVMGFISWYLLRRQPEPKRALPATEDMTSFEYIMLPLRDKQFRRLLFFSFYWIFSAFIASPFWMPFMMNNLKFTFIDIQIYGTIATLASISAVKYWGKLIDRFGNKPIMAITIVLGFINPLFWVMVSPKVYWLVDIEAFTSGIMWSGAGIITTNFILSIAPQKERDMYIAVFSGALGIAGAISALLSGGLLELVKPMNLLGFHLVPAQFMFLLCALMRLSAEIPLYFVKEKGAKSIGHVIMEIVRFFKPFTGAKDSDLEI